MFIIVTKQKPSNFLCFERREELNVFRGGYVSQYCVDKTISKKKSILSEFRAKKVLCTQKTISFLI